MTITNGYCTLNELKASGVSNIGAAVTTYDTVLEMVIESASRAIDNYCGRHFYQDAAATRYFTPIEPHRVAVDDIYNTSGLAIYTDDGADGTYENTWATTDYNLLPTNALTKGLPYTAIEIKLLGNYRFPRYRSSVKVTANWGWSAVPKPVQVACLMMSYRHYKRFATILGEASSTPLGQVTLKIPAMDPDIMKLLAPYVRLEEE